MKNYNASAIKLFCIVHCLLIVFIAGCNNKSQRNKTTQLQDEGQAVVLMQDTIHSLKVIGKGRISTFQEGIDLGEVVLWSSTGSSRHKRGSMKKNERVSILEEADPYVLVKSDVDSSSFGYVLKDFVK